MSQQQHPVMLGDYFSLAEFMRTKHGTLQGEPPKQALLSMAALVCKVLDPLRRHVGRPVIVTSGYRSPAVNAAVKGSRTSDHMAGRAADIKAPGWTSRDLASAIVALGLPFDQVIWYAEERGGHVHVSYRGERDNRYQVRHAPAGGGYTQEAP